MLIKLLDWQGAPKVVEVPDDTLEVSGIILSGDMVMTRPFRVDASDNRINDFYDGDWFVRREDFGRLWDMQDSYDVFDLCSAEEGVRP